MDISKEEILHIANLARLNIKEEEIEKYASSLQDILNFANIIKEAPTQGLDITIGSTERKNIFRPDEVKTFEDSKSLMENAPSKEQNMFRIPKVL